MRRLLYIPILHEERDIGSIGVALARTSARLVGKGRWAEHRETLLQFWQQVAAFLNSFDPAQLKIYQDGIPAEGEVGRRIVEEAARRGSQNYRLILDLLNRGAELRKTEDPVLLFQELQNLLRIAQPGSAQKADPERGEDEGDPSNRARLLKERDRHIAQAINASLKEGEVGVLFIGAEHQVAPLLAQDITLVNIKAPNKVRAYLEALFLGRDGGRLAELTQYLRAPIKVLEEGGRDEQR